MPQAPIGVAMLGAGFIAEYHLAGLAGAGGAQVRVIASRSADKARALAERFGVDEVSIDVNATLARDDVQAVVITTPDDTHEALALAAAQRGKAILLQKPIAGSVEAAQRIVEGAKGQGVDLQVSFMHRFFDEVVAARAWLDEGLIGRVHGARVRNATPGPDWGAWFFRRASVPHGVVDQLGVHGIDLVEQLLGRIDRVSGHTRIARPQRRLADGSLVDVEVPDNANAVYTLDDGVVVSHEMSMTERGGCDRFRMEIYGDEGTLWLRTSRGRLAALVPARFGNEWHVPALPETSPGRLQHETWLAGLRGDAAPLATADEALSGMRVVEALARSSERGGAAVPVAGAVDDAPPEMAAAWGVA